MDNKELVTELLRPQPVVIGLEGGPCGGKTTLINAVLDKAEELGKTVVALHEAASIHISELQNTGQNIVDLAMNDRPAYLEIQEKILRTIISGIENAKRKNANTESVIVVDRVDIGAYVTTQEYKAILSSLKQRLPPMHQYVDKLIYLPSAASVDPSKYEALRHNNTARLESSPEQASAVCMANLQAVCTHPELEIVWGGDFQTNISRLTNMILNPHTEGEIKFSVAPNAAQNFLSQINKAGGLLTSSFLRQSYYNVAGQEFRLRKTFSADNVVTNFFAQKTGRGVFRNEVQRKISDDQFEQLAGTNQVGRSLSKVRHLALDNPTADSARRQWYLDQYHTPFIDNWHFETSVSDLTEADELYKQHPDRKVVTQSAQTINNMGE